MEGIVMPYFMITIDVNAWDRENFLVHADTSGAALVKVLNHLNAVATERVLHSVHRGSVAHG